MVKSQSLLMIVALSEIKIHHNSGTDIEQRLECLDTRSQSFNLILWYSICWIICGFSAEQWDARAKRNMYIQSKILPFMFFWRLSCWNKNWYASPRQHCMLQKWTRAGHKCLCERSKQIWNTKKRTMCPLEPKAATLRALYESHWTPGRLTTKKI